MSQSDFHVDLNINPDLPESLEIEAIQRIRDLTKGRDDLIGASISVEEIAGDQESYLYEAGIVVYLRPENIAVTKKDTSPEAALKHALSTLERSVREDRNRRSSHE